MSLPDRVELIRQSDSITGIDFVQVSEDQLELLIYIHHVALPAPLATQLATVTEQNIQITAVGKIEPVQVPVIQHITPVPVINGRPALHLVVGQPGGFGYYQLSIDHPVFDSYFNNITFTFKTSCESQFDCKPVSGDCPPEDSMDFPVDYRARDFWSFRQALTDFAAQRYPHWQDRLEADMGMMLTELLSALGDEFSYAQDRIKRETNFADAEQRRTLRHFANLMDYTIDNGSGASAWLDITANANGVLAAGTPVTDQYAQVVFELGYGLRDLGKFFSVSDSRNEFIVHVWDENDTCLARGGSELTLNGNHAAEFLPDPDIDPVGKWVLLATRPVEPDIPERRIMVRVIGAVDDTDPVTGELITNIQWDAPTEYDLDLTTLVVRGNLLPATAGESYPPVSEAALRFRVGAASDPLDPDADLPRVIERAGANTSFARQDEDGRVKFLLSLPDSDAMPLVWLDSQSGVQPEVHLQREPAEDWQWMPAMIGEEVAGPTHRAFTLEEGTYRTVFGTERLGGKINFEDYASGSGFSIRFGDGEFGAAPRDGDIFSVRYRLGNGRLTNVSADTLTRFKSEFDDPSTRPAFVDDISNPLAAIGGRDPETAEQIKVNAPEAYKAVTYRAVRPEDYTEIIERLDWVQKAGTQFRWTGSWPTVFVTPDPLSQVGLSGEQRSELHSLLNRVRQVGRETCVRTPVYVSLDLQIKICVHSTAYPGQVKQRVLTALFGNNGENGFFHPDNFTFGTALSRASLVAAIQDVAGVHAVNGVRIRRRGWFTWRPFSEFNYRVGINEVINVTNNPLLPERGSVRLIMEGGA